MKLTRFHSAYFLFAIPICGVWRSRQRGTDRREANKDQVEAIKQDEKISEEGTKLEIIQEIINYRLEHTTKNVDDGKSSPEPKIITGWKIWSCCQKTSKPSVKAEYQQWNINMMFHVS